MNLDALAPSLPIGSVDTPGQRGPRVSVVIPTHNRAHLLARAIASVLQQTHADLEVVVVDDASEDDTETIVANFHDDRIRFQRLGARAGPSRARNRGINASRGEFVAFLDSDDEWLPAKLERQVSCLAQRGDPARTLVYCAHARRDALTGRTITKRQTMHEGACFAQLARGWAFMLSAVLVARSTLLAAGGFDETLAAGEDHDLWLRLAVAGVRFAAVKETLVIVHHHPGPHLSADPRTRRDALLRLDTKWRERIRATVGASSYRRWRRAQYALLQQAQFMRAREAVAVGDRAVAWRECLAMCRCLPWSRRFVAQAVVLLLLGKGVYRALARAEDALLRHAGGD